MSYVVPKPHIQHDDDVIKPAYKPTDTVAEAAKITFWSGVFLGGLQVRRYLQHRKGSARPGQARYLSLFDLQPHQFASIPLALGTYSFLSNSFYNLNNGKRTTKAEMLASGSAILVATIFKKDMALNKKFGLAIGVASFVGLFKWAGGFVDSYDSSLAYYRQSGQIHDQESNRALDAGISEDGSYKKQGFWEVMYRRPLSETIHDLGEGRGIGKA